MSFSAGFERPSPDSESLYRRMVTIRLVEQTLLELFAAGAVSGTTHTSIGQEADAVGVVGALGQADPIFSNHRCHGHFLARTDDVDGLLLEIAGDARGVCGGRGGSQHLCRDGFYSNGVQGGIVPAAAGVALAERERGAGSVTTVFLGDGTLGQGVVYETFNLAALWRLPLLIVIEHNHYAQSTPTRDALAGSLERRAEPFGIPVAKLETTDAERILQATRAVVAAVRAGQGPAVLILDTYRFSPHSKGDDHRDPAEIAARRIHDPLLVAARKLPALTAASVEHAARERVRESVARAFGEERAALVPNVPVVAAAAEVAP